MKVLDRITTSSARIDFLRPTKKGRDHVRKYDGVAQRQHRIGSDFTWRKQWAWLCSGHGSKSFLLSLSATTRPCAATAIAIVLTSLRGGRGAGVSITAPPFSPTSAPSR